MTHYRDHPIYLFIRDFHLKFQAVVRASCDEKMVERFGTHVITGPIYELLKDILLDVREDQIIKQKKNVLKVKKYKETLCQWVQDWFTNGLHEPLPEVLYFWVYFLH